MESIKFLTKDVDLVTSFDDQSILWRTSRIHVKTKCRRPMVEGGQMYSSCLWILWSPNIPFSHQYIQYLSKKRCIHMFAYWFSAWYQWILLLTKIFESIFFYIILNYLTHPHYIFCNCSSFIYSAQLPGSFCVCNAS